MSSSPALWVGLLGSLEVRVGGRMVTLGSPAQRRLLADAVVLLRVHRLLSSSTKMGRPTVARLEGLLLAATERRVGALVRWCVGALVRWCVGALVRWCVDALLRTGRVVEALASADAHVAAEASRDAAVGGRLRALAADGRVSHLVALTVLERSADFAAAFDHGFGNDIDDSLVADQGWNRRLLAFVGTESTDDDGARAAALSDEALKPHGRPIGQRCADLLAVVVWHGAPRARYRATRS